MNSDDDDDGDVSTGSFEEYEWAGQTRVRVTSMTNGGLAGLGFQVRLHWRDWAFSGMASVDRWCVVACCVPAGGVFCVPTGGVQAGAAQ